MSKRAAGSPGSPSRGRARDPKVALEIKREPHPNELCEMVLQALEQGYPLVIAANKGGVDGATVRAWARRDESFARALRIVEGQRRAVGWDALDKAGEHWRREAWKLEKTVPEFSDKRDVSAEVRARVLQLLDELAPLMSKGAYGELLDAMARIDSGSAVAETQALGAGEAGDSGNRQAG